MSCTPHTKKELIHLAPKYMLEKHVETLKLNQCIIDELWEQIVFFGEQKITKMCYWNKEQFEDWYYNSD